ncbi:cysteine dioxygenase family protein [Natrinema salsiterrestre]|uniref:Cysteine dioxygenase family protein n=1 Tax=Natrinema salsiterrestre TaxID=2950540 RepID=A0A9Q4L589_9EURY|nr:cysteine dioxygenase family protein [Natrinema salsiterrestre]MDF9746180.1 cysteine dioxygenase family protein [Natrinema salsiterrestre]
MASPNADPEPEFVYDTDRVRDFVDTVKETANEHDEIPALLEALAEPFEALLADDDWLDERYQRLPADDEEDSGNMGDDIAQWLLYREGNKLSLFTLVLPPGASTPVHDHLAWGLVGIYGGTQREDFYRRVDDGTTDEGEADLERIRTDRMERGDYYELIPPNNDIHSVETTSAEPSVSVHLLGADVGCIERHAFDADDGTVELFHSGYTNVACDDVLDTPTVGHGHHDANDHRHDHAHE